jgi:hypothetical protein
VGWHQPHITAAAARQLNLNPAQHHSSPLQPLPRTQPLSLTLPASLPPDSNAVRGGGSTGGGTGGSTARYALEREALLRAQSEGVVYVVGRSALRAAPDSGLIKVGAGVAWWLLVGSWRVLGWLVGACGLFNEWVQKAALLL